MSRTSIILFILAVLLVVAGFGVRKYYRSSKSTESNTTENLSETTIHSKAMPEGFTLQAPQDIKIGIFAEGLDRPRDLIEDPKGTILVSVLGQDKVVALTDSNNDGTADTNDVVADKVNGAHGLALKCENATHCTLFVAGISEVARFDYDIATHQSSNRQKLVDLPSAGSHTTRSLLLLPPPNDSELLVAIGSTCNVCEEEDPHRATIYIMNIDGSNFRLYANGLRNSVFMTTNPDTGATWATDMGRDLIGDDIPPDEVNIIEANQNYGWPWCYGQSIIDTDFKGKLTTNPCTEKTAVKAHIDVPAHSAPLGLAFAPKTGWRSTFQENLFVALHGSTHRSMLTGYKIIRYSLNRDGSVKETHDFLTGWQKNSSVFGRPADIVFTKNGSMYMSDDKNGTIYRLSDNQAK